MNKFLLFFTLIRSTVIAALPQSKEFHIQDTLNQAFADGYFGPEALTWRIERKLNKEEAGSLFAPSQSYDYFLLRADSESDEANIAEATELMADFEATLSWMVINGYLYSDGARYVALEKCLQVTELVINN